MIVAMKSKTGKASLCHQLLCHTGSAVMILMLAITALLTACGGGSSSKTASAVISSFTASPTSIASGASSTLSWSVSGATTVSIDNGVGTVTGSSVTVKPTATTTYTLTATNSAGSVTATATVTVTGTTATVPVISSFSASPTSITSGASSTLSWSVSGATTVSINNGVGTVTGSSVTVKPTATTTYTLTATNSTGSVTATATVTVTAAVVVAPTITSFAVSTSTITSGGSTNLTWIVSLGATVTINNGVGKVTGNSVKVSPTATTTYTLTATSSTGATATAQITVTVVPSASISIFQPAASVVATGGSTTLSWSTSNASTLTLTASDGSISNLDVTSVTPPYSVTPASSTSTTYTLTATNVAGDSVTKTTAVNVLSMSGFKSNLTTIIKGQNSATLSWTANNAASFSLAALDTVTNTTTYPAVSATATSLVVSPTDTTEYTLTATDSLGDTVSSGTVTVTVDSSLGLITSFMANNPANDPTTTGIYIASTSVGGSMTLTPVFASTDTYGNSVTAIISNDQDSTTIDVTSASGTAQTIAAVNASTNYTLTVTDSVAGVSQTQTVRVIAGSIVAYAGQYMAKAYPAYYQCNATWNKYGGFLTKSRFCEPWGMTIGFDGNLYFVDSGEYVVTELNASTQLSSDYAGVQRPTAADLTPVDGANLSAVFYSPQYIAADSSNNLYTLGKECAVRKITSTTVSTLAGTAGLNNQGAGTACYSSGSAYAYDVDGQGSAAVIPYNQSKGIVVDSVGDVIIAEELSIRAIDASGNVVTLAGECDAANLCESSGSVVDGPGSTARFATLQAITIDSNDVIYISDGGGTMIRVMTPTKGSGTIASQWSWNVTTWINSSMNSAVVDGPASVAQFGFVNAMAIDSNKTLYLLDEGERQVTTGGFIRRITPDGVVDTIAGNDNLPTPVSSIYTFAGSLPDEIEPGRAIVVDPASSQLFFNVMDAEEIFVMPR